MSPNRYGRRPSEASAVPAQSVVDSLMALESSPWMESSGHSRRYASGDPGATSPASPTSSDLQTMRARLQKLTEEKLAASRERDAAVASHKEAVEMLENKIAELSAKSESETTRLNSKIRELETQLSEQIRKFDSLKRESEQKSSELDVEMGLSKRKISLLTASLEKASRERDDAVNEKHRFQEEVERLDLRRKQAAEQAAENQRRLAEVDGQRSALQMEVDQLTSRLEIATASNAKRELEHTKLQRLLSEAETNVAHWEQKAKSMEIDLSSARNSLATSGIEKTTLLAQIDQWRKRCHAAETMSSRNAAQAAALCEEIVQRTQEFGKLFKEGSNFHNKRGNMDAMDMGPPMKNPYEMGSEGGTDTDEDLIRTGSHQTTSLYPSPENASIHRPDDLFAPPPITSSSSVEEPPPSPTPTDVATDHDSSVEDDKPKPSHKRRLFSSSGEDDAADNAKKARADTDEEGNSPTQPSPHPHDNSA
eukprot:Blabericola_migrator_1__3595@NODE_2070_length_3325_cov_151_055556_g1311_i0_p1_GENE_NODE_2070_length_3325_cov_151_055556_g1311_i0NODE_2070_length_3325_cov_151_055556_g1311_i0_p1_ORF_typecomplete_len536_score122_43CEP63/PF17045_5/1_4e05CEP63/PF17045_5/1_3e02CCCAP/PF15964_5/0_054CCCAP/PF15964_5/0_0014DUF3584/PF12128_8/0_00079Myosin_tail_1/PF01576_19/0_0038HMMR_N/PF15905_5/0_0033HMMR_N/PF15905_5/85KASH_CCD/PF14662_6/1_6e03KASH_CCD/PF14662_6/0_0045MAD/PF05557_13/0_42MAD/PF05557_13/0_1BBP1_C/PF15272_6